MTSPTFAALSDTEQTALGDRYATLIAAIDAALETST